MATPAPTLFKDPVCGMTVNPATAAARVTHLNTTYYFCAKSCAAKFTADPEKYLSPKPAPSTTTPAAPNTEYICPMDPEVLAHKPGPCPICGMALEPRTISLTEDTTELRDMQRRLIISAALSTPMLLLMLADLLPAMPLRHALSSHTISLTELALATPVVLYCGAPFFQRAWQSVVNRALNMFTLIAIGTGAAFLYSLIATLAPQLFPATLHTITGEIPLYFEPAAVIIALVLLGQVMELRARSRTGSAIRALLNLAPKTATRIHQLNTPFQSESEIPLDVVILGDTLRIRPG